MKALYNYLVSYFKDIDFKEVSFKSLSRAAGKTTQQL